MDEFKVFLITMVVIFALAGALLCIIAGGVVFVMVNITQANLVEVYVGDTMVYQGKLAYIAIESGGMTTTIAIHKRLWPFPVIDRTYSGADIKVVPCEMNK